MKSSPTSTSSPLSRRHFVAQAATGAGLLILPSGLRAGAATPSNRVNVALIGVLGRGRTFHDTLEEEANVVALCDINENHLNEAKQRFPKAKTHVDWRKCLEQKDIDGVIICTTDHTHAFVTNWAMNRNLHVYCEKPLASSVEEARFIRSRWLKKKGKIASQVGTGTAVNHNRIRDLIRGGAIGELKAAYAWTNRAIYRNGYWPSAGAPPKGLHWDLWLGPAPEHPYNPRYLAKGNYRETGEREHVGANAAACMSWNCFWDFGSGQIGDMGSHDMNMVWNAIDAKWPTSAEAKGDPLHPEVIPVALEAQWEHPANDWRGPISVLWSQGGPMPRSPVPFVDLKQVRDGCMFKGTEGFIVGDFRTGARALLPFGDKADFTYFKSPRKEAVTPTHAHSPLRWLEACKDPSIKTPCDFEYGANMIEQQLLGLVAYRAGRKIAYDGATGRVTDCPEANAFLTKEVRKGWTIDG